MPKQQRGEETRSRILEAATVVPGHGPLGGDWKAALERQRAYLEAVADGTRREVRAGGTIRTAVEKVALPQARTWLLFDEYHGRNVTAAFVELEWE